MDLSKLTSKKTKTSHSKLVFYEDKFILTDDLFNDHGGEIIGEIKLPEANRILYTKTIFHDVDKMAMNKRCAISFGLEKDGILKANFRGRSCDTWKRYEKILPLIKITEIIT